MPQFTLHNDVYHDKVSVTIIIAIILFCVMMMPIMILFCFAWPLCLLLLDIWMKQGLRVNN